jgi:hypothetical protein
MNLDQALFALAGAGHLLLDLVGAIACGFYATRSRWAIVLAVAFGVDAVRTIAFSMLPMAFSYGSYAIAHASSALAFLTRAAVVLAVSMLLHETFGPSRPSR